MEWSEGEGMRGGKGREGEEWRRGKGRSEGEGMDILS